MENLSASHLTGPLNGPTFIESGATHLLICLHGFGADGNDLAALASPLQAALAAQGLTLGVACPNGPAPTPAGMGRQWFSDKGWTFRDKDGIAAAQNLLWDYLNALHTHTGIAFANMAVLGFSQGAMTALYAAPRWPELVGGVIGCAGVAMWQEELDAATCQKPPIVLIHGLEDDVVPADASVNAQRGLEALGFTTQLELLAGLGHGIDARVLAHVVSALAEWWGKPFM
jgi:phospholipase/carboxylesterase